MKTSLGMVFGLLLAGLAPRTAEAQQIRSDANEPYDVRMRFDTFFRGVPRYLLTVQDGAASADDRYWRLIATAPLQQRIALDANHLIDGHLEAHLSTWGAIDLAAPTADGHIAGDVAVAWTKYRRGPFGVWLGRRFLPWGAPGGVHLDGAGGEMALGAGVTFEAIVGRPVTPTYGGLLGGHPGFDGVTAAGGARLGFSHAGRASVAVSFLEHWAQGIPVRRVVEASFVLTPLRWLDARGTISGDLLGLGVMQADLDVSAWLNRTLEFDVGYGHLNPALLIPRYSILSVFVTRTFDEGRGRVSWRILPTISVALEGAVQHYDVPGDVPAQYGPQWGSRVAFMAQAATIDRRVQVLATVSNRDDGVQRMLLVRLAGSFPIVREIFGALEAAVAVDNYDFTATRTSWYGRAGVDGPIVGGWRLGASVDGIRSPIATSELRGMVHLTAFLDLHGGRR